MDGFARQDKLALGRLYRVPVINPAAGTVPSLRVIGKETTVAGPKAPADGTYSVNGLGRFRVKKGAVMPDGAAFTPRGEPAQAEPKSGRPAATDEDRGELYASALKAAGYSLFKESELIPGELVESEGMSDEDQGEHFASLLKAAGYELKQTKKPKENAESKGPSETATTGPSETA